MQTYSKEFREEITKKALTYPTSELKDLAKGIGIPYSTLYYWVASTKKMKPNDEKNAPKSMPVRPQNWSVEAKLQAIIETASMTEEEISAYCRQKGLYVHHIQEWKQRCIEGMKPSSVNKKSEEVQQLKSENLQLKKELHRKDKALAETSALLVLKKKANLIWGDTEDD